MVKTPTSHRKYLCMAPRPDTWDDYAEAVLKNLGKTNAARREALNQTLDAARTNNPSFTEKSGPGRKTNTEHAIHFYEYLLEVLDGREDDDEEESEEEQESEEASSSEEEEEAEESEEEVSSMDTQDFNAQHDLCDVCHEAGALLMCNTCNLSFHVNCVRPVMTELPDNPIWRCSYCVLLTEPKGTAVRHTAAVAVRLMARLRNGIRRQKSAKKKKKKKSGKDKKGRDRGERKPSAPQITTETKEMEESPDDADRKPAAKEKSGKDKEERDRGERKPSAPQKTTETKEKEESPEDAERKPAAKEKSGKDEKERDRGERKSHPTQKTKETDESPEDADRKPAAKEKSGKDKKERGRGERKSHPTQKTKETEGSQEDADRKPAAKESKEAPEEPEEAPKEAAKEARKEAPESKEAQKEGPKESIESSEATKTDATVETPKKASKDETEQGSSKGEHKEDESKKRNLELFKLSSSFSPTLSVETSPDSGRGKRSRKQPTLYDPQNVAARKWQSDGLQEWKGGPEKSDDDDVHSGDDSNDGETEEGASGPRGRKKGEEIWCSFCKDDPSIKVCCFCACRVCFGKHHQTKLLLCDRCDEEYHTFCLNPPLRSVPKARKWFCPTCVATEAKRSARSTPHIGTRGAKRKETPSPRRSSSRKAIKKVPHGESKAKASGGRPRGRPRKSSPKKGRKRGRPPKSKSLGPPRKRGRPSKSESPSARAANAKTAEEKAAASISASSAAAAAAFVSNVNTPMIAVGAASVAVANAMVAPGLPSAGAPAPSSVPVTVSRSGRMVKRSSFHDEIDEGEQHLRVGRYALDSLRKASPEQAAGAVATGVSLTSNAFLTMPTTGPVASLKQVPTVAASMQPTHSQAATTTVPVPAAHPTQGGTFSVKAPAVPPAGLPFSIPTTAAADGVTLPVQYGAAALASAPAIMPPAAFAPGAGVAAASMAAQAALLREEPGRSSSKTPRRKPGARECMQISRRFGVRPIPDKYMNILLDYCNRGKVEHLVRMRERLDEHARNLEVQLAGLEALARERGESDVVVPEVPLGPDPRLERTPAFD